MRRLSIKPRDTCPGQRQRCRAMTRTVRGIKGVGLPLVVHVTYVRVINVGTIHVPALSGKQ